MIKKKETNSATFQNWEKTVKSAFKFEMMLQDTKSVSEGGTSTSLEKRGLFLLVLNKKHLISFYSCGQCVCVVVKTLFLRG